MAWWPADSVGDDLGSPSRRKYGINGGLGRYRKAAAPAGRGSVPHVPLVEVVDNLQEVVVRVDPLRADVKTVPDEVVMPDIADGQVRSVAQDRSAGLAVPQRLVLGLMSALLIGCGQRLVQVGLDRWVGVAGNSVDRKSVV